MGAHRNADGFYRGHAPARGDLASGGAAAGSAPAAPLSSSGASAPGGPHPEDGRGLGPQPPSNLPANLLGCQDDPFRSLVWKLKREGVIEAAPLIPFHEFRWGAWLRRKALPPFNSLRLEPALPAARAYARSAAASRLAGWKG